MSDDKSAAPAKSGGGFFKFMTIVLLPFALFGGYNLKPVVDNAKKEAAAGTTFKDVWNDIKAGKTDRFAEIIKKDPEQGASVVIFHAAKNDKEFRELVIGQVARLTANKVIDRGQGSAVVKELNSVDEKSADTEKK